MDVARLSGLRHGAVGKPSVKARLVMIIEPEARRSKRGQDESRLTATGGPN